MTHELNAAIMNDPCLIEVKAKVDKEIHGVQSSLKFDGSAEYHLTVLPMRLKRLDEANDNLSIVGTTVEAEVLGKLDSAHPEIEQIP